MKLLVDKLLMIFSGVSQYVDAGKDQKAIQVTLFSAQKTVAGATCVATVLDGPTGFGVTNGGGKARLLVDDTNTVASVTCTFPGLGSVSSSVDLPKKMNKLILAF